MHWVRYFIKHQLGGMSKIIPLEFNRAKWFTSKNIQKYYEIYRDTVLELKLAMTAALARLDGECKGDVDRLHIPELVAIIGNKTFQMPKTGQKREYYRVIVKDLLKDNPGVRDFNAGMLEIEGPADEDLVDEE